MNKWNGVSRHVRDGVVVVLSILLAFGIDAAWDNRTERAEERALLEGLYSELTANRQEIEEIVTTARMAQNAARRFAAITPEQAATIHPDSATGQVIRYFYRSFVDELSYGFLSATVSSGKLALIQDASLRAALAEIASLGEDVSEPAAALSRLTEEGTRAIAHYPEIAAVFGLSGSVPADAMGALRADTNAMAILGTKVMYWEGYSRALGALGDRLDAAAAQILAQLQ